MTKILFIPDSQVKPGDDFEFLRCIGRYIVEKQPDIIVHAGDFADMESLSSYDKGKRSYEGRRYKADIQAAHEGMEALLGPLREHNERRIQSKKRPYRPRMVLTLGNHEHRINRTVNDEPLLDGTISTDDLNYEGYGWEVYPFLEVVVIEGIAFSHYFTTGAMGRPASTSAAMLNKKHMSCIAGHQQGRQSSTGVKADGRQITAIIAGSCYEHAEDYLGPQGNKHWHGIIMLHNVVDGEFDEMFAPLSYIKQKYAA
ncbi:metallophosphoesterase [Massilia sp. PWRC2]|uniref:metallophosphoesterase n=1 Tax=Massilia sp. PWRC2 TaxID=2804626 RepID=UPI003CECE6A9